MNICGMDIRNLISRWCLDLLNMIPTILQSISICSGKSNLAIPISRSSENYSIIMRNLKNSTFQGLVIEIHFLDKNCVFLIVAEGNRSTLELLPCLRIIPKGKMIRLIGLCISIGRVFFCNCVVSWRDITIAIGVSPLQLNAATSISRPNYLFNIARS